MSSNSFPRAGKGKKPLQVQSCPPTELSDYFVQVREFVVGTFIRLGVNFSSKFTIYEQIIGVAAVFVSFILLASDVWSILTQIRLRSMFDLFLTTQEKSSVSKRPDSIASVSVFSTRVLSSEELQSFLEPSSEDATISGNDGKLGFILFVSSIFTMFILVELLFNKVLSKSEERMQWAINSLQKFVETITRNELISFSLFMLPLIVSSASYIIILVKGFKVKGSNGVSDANDALVYVKLSLKGMCFLALTALSVAVHMYELQEKYRRRLRFRERNLNDIDFRLRNGEQNQANQDNEALAAYERIMHELEQRDITAEDYTILSQLDTLLYEIVAVNINLNLTAHANTGPQNEGNELDLDLVVAENLQDDQVGQPATSSPPVTNMAANVIGFNDPVFDMIARKRTKAKLASDCLPVFELGSKLHRHYQITMKECPVCFDDLQPGDKIKVMPCMHKAHEACLNEWIETNPICPICKLDFENVKQMHADLEKEQISEIVSVNEHFDL